MILSNGKHSFNIEIDDDTYWQLIKLAADLKMYPEDYAENIILGHVESELDRKIKD